MKDTEPNVAVQSSKQKFSLKDALFGGGAGTSGTDYKIIYFGNRLKEGKMRRSK